MALLALLRRCLAALAEWELLSVQCRAEWRRAEPHVKREMAPMAAHAAWHMGQWGEMDTYVHTMNRDSTPDDSAGAFLTAVLNVHGGSHAVAKREARVLPGFCQGCGSCMMRTSSWSLLSCCRGLLCSTIHG